MRNVGFKGRPEHIINYLRFIAEEARGILASLGLRSLDEAVGRSDLLELNTQLAVGKAATLDFSDMLHRVDGSILRWQGESYAQVTLDDKELMPALGKAHDIAVPGRQPARWYGGAFAVLC